MDIDKTLGLILPPETFLFSRWVNTYYFSEVLRGAIAAASLFKWDILINHKMFSGRNYTNFYQGEKIRGMVLVAPALIEDAITRIKKIDIPVIIINGRYPDISYVDTDNKEGAKNAVEYLIEMGHKKIAIINGKMDITDARDRYEGYKRALINKKIKLDKNLVRNGDFSEDSGYFGMSSIIESQLREKKQIPTAVFCTNDLMAFGAMKAINEKGLNIPDDISVVGFDDIIISSFTSPSLTTVRQQFFHIGKEAVITLLDIINGEKEGCQKVEIETRLIKRESVASPKKRSIKTNKNL